MNTNDERASGEEDLYLIPATIELVTVKRLVYLPQKKAVQTERYCGLTP